MAEIGITLRNGRVQRGLTIDQVAQETRISPRFLEALEAEAFDELPAPVYVRGFLRSYANFLHLDPTPLLEQLASSGGAPISGPDGFVRGPRANTQARKPSTNPFRPAAPATRSQPEHRSAPPPEPVMPVAAAAAAAYEDEIDEGWAPERLPGAFDDAPAVSGRSYPANPQLDDFEPAAAYTEPEPRYRPRRSSGMLLERDVAEGGGGSTRTLAIAAGAVVVLLFFLAVGVLLTRGGGGSNAAAPPQSATATSKPGTVISALGTQTGVPGTPTAAGSTTASPSASASPSPNATTTAAATSQPGNTTTPPPTTSTTATAAPTQAPTVAPTPLPPTPTPPTAIPTPPPPAGFQECGGTSSDPECGPMPYRVVCYPPHGRNDWFVDVTKSYPVPADQGWSTQLVNSASLGPVITAGQSGC